jgi:hypothetical protein
MKKKKAHAVLVLPLAITSNYRKSDHQQFNPFRIAPRHSLHDLIFECHTFGVIFLEPCFRGVDACKDLEMIGVTDLLVRVDVDEDCHCWSLLSFRRPQ